MNYKKIVLSSFLLLLFSITFSLAQETEITMRKKGFGEDSKQVFITIHNTGDTVVSDVEIYVDGEVVQTVKGRSAPTNGFEISLNLEPGEHLIEAKTPEGAYDSLEITISSVNQKSFLPPKEKSFIETTNFRLIVTSGILIVIVLWLLVKKPKLEL